MKKLSYLSFLCVVLLMCLPGRAAAQCGVERWSVKTGTDPDAGLVSLSSINPATIGSLTAIAIPASLPDNNRVRPTETTVFVVSATLVKYVRAFDSDYHMVLADSVGRTMIAEIPAPGCVGPGSPFAAGIAHARAQFDAMFTATTTFQTANVPVQITGVGFFDHLEGQEGLAPNGIELHPIIDILFNPSFTISASPSSLTIAQSGSGTSTITTTLSGNFNSSIAFSATGLPAGATASFTPSSIGAPGAGSSTLTISVGAATPIGTYNVLVNGTGGGQTHSATINLTVTSAGGTTQQLLGNAGFESGSNPAPWTVTPAVIDSSTLEAPHTGSWKAWLNGYGSAHTDSILQQIAIPSTVSQAVLSFWLQIDTAETTTTTAFDTMRVQLRNSSGTVLTTLATYSNLNAGAGYAQVSFDITSYKGQTIQVYLVGTENTSLKTSFVVDDFALNATTPAVPADFAISSSPSALTIARGSSGTSTITTTVSGSFNAAIALSASGLPTGATASFAPTSIAAPGAGSSTLTISVGSATAVGTYPVTVNGAGGGLTRTTTINLTVTGGGGTTQQLLGNAGFENGSSTPAPWTVTPLVIDNNSSSEPPHAGSWKAWLDGYGSAHTDTILQTVSIPSTATQATLSFWLHIDTLETSTTAANDTLKVQVRNSSGTVLATLATYSNLSAAAGYRQVSFDLAAYKGQTIQIYLIGVENSSLKTSFVVDDFLLNVVTP
jgi:hypothetical protein